MSNGNVDAAPIEMLLVVTIGADCTDVMETGAKGAAADVSPAVALTERRCRGGG